MFLIDDNNTVGKITILLGNLILIIPPETLLQGYASAIFPMADGKTGTIQWYSADPRGIIDLNDYYISKRLMRYIKNLQYEIKVDKNFDQVIKYCAKRPEEQGVWISQEIIDSYINLHYVGFAHSFEVYIEDKLVAGLYGVALRSAFFGESMFNLPAYPNTSKIALFYLIQHLVKNNFKLLDIQMITSTTKQFGAKLVNKSNYMKLLKNALSFEAKF